MYEDGRAEGTNVEDSDHGDGKDNGAGIVLPSPSPRIGDGSLDRGLSLLADIADDGVLGRGGRGREFAADIGEMYSSNHCPDLFADWKLCLAGEAETAPERSDG